MGATFVKSDRLILSLIGECGILTVSQIAAFSGRTRQVIRRRLRALRSKNLVATAIRGYGRAKGRPEELISLTEGGKRFLSEAGLLPSNDVTRGHRQIESICVDHELLVNWFRIHLLQIEKVKQNLSAKYLFPSNSVSLVRDNEDPFTCCVSSNDHQNKLIQFVPDGIFSISLTQSENKTTLLFFLEVDMGTETMARTDRDSKDVRQKILNYQTLFRGGRYKKYERIFDATFNGFRLLFLAKTNARFTALCRLVREMPPSDFIWLTDQEKMFSRGIFADIWAKGGRGGDVPRSILGPRLSCEMPVLPIIR